MTKANHPWSSWASDRSTAHSGRLGPKRGSRYRAYERLTDYLRHRQGDLFLTDQIRAAI